jgi:hypothetical protein
MNNFLIPHPRASPASLENLKNTLNFWIIEFEFGFPEFYKREKV